MKSLPRTKNKVKIFGLQKLTLLDYPQKVACTIFTGGCNLRCPFCHNASLVLGGAKEIPVQEVTAFLKKRAGLLDGVCLTGGEPLLQPDVCDFLAEVRGLGYAVKLDTNGSLPERLREILDARLVDYVAMDIKNSPARYAETVGVEGFDVESVRQSAELLMKGSVDYEFRTTVVRELHTIEDMHDIGRWLAGAKRYFLQAFEDSGDLISCGLSAVSAQETEKMRRVLSRYIPAVSLRAQ